MKNPNNRNQPILPQFIPVFKLFTSHLKSTYLHSYNQTNKYSRCVYLYLKNDKVQTNVNDTSVLLNTKDGVTQGSLITIGRHVEAQMLHLMHVSAVPRCSIQACGNNSSCKQVGYTLQAPVTAERLTNGGRLCMADAT